MNLSRRRPPAAWCVWAGCFAFALVFAASTAFALGSEADGGGSAQDTGSEEQLPEAHSAEQTPGDEAAAPAVLAPPDTPEAAPGFERFQIGVDHWLLGRRALAADAWRAALEEHPDSPLRAALLYNLGGAAWHAGRPLEAVGWYTAARPHAPRDPDLLENLERARRLAELEPLDRGDLASALEQALHSVTEREARWLALFGLFPLFTALIGEALRGGAAWRWTALLTLLLAAAAAAPYASQRLAAERDPHLVIAERGARLSPDPGGAGFDPPRTGAYLEPGEVVERIDTLGSWTRIQNPTGARGWLPTEDLFPLRR